MITERNKTFTLQLKTSSYLFKLSFQHQQFKRKSQHSAYIDGQCGYRETTTQHMAQTNSITA